MPFVLVQESKAGLNGAEGEGTVYCGMGGGHRRSRLGCCESWLYLEREAYLFIFFLSRNSNWFPDLSVGGREGQPSVTLSFVVLASGGGAGVKNTRVFLPAGGDSLSPWQLSHIQN